MEMKVETITNYPACTKELLVKGIDFTEDVVLEAYQAVIKIRPLKDLELYQLLDLAEKTGCTEMLKEENLKKKDLKVLIKATKLLEEACFMAIIWPDLPRIDLPGVGKNMTPEEIEKINVEKRERISLLKGLSTVDIGIAILNLSIGSLDSIKNLQKAQSD